MRARKIVTAPLKLIRKLVPKSRRESTLQTTPALEADAWAYSDSKSGLQAVPSSSVSKSEKPNRKPPPLEECPICQDPVGISNPEHIIESWTSLHCGHRFGNVCIQTWLQESLERNDPHNPNPSCPICRELAKHPKCGHLVCPQPDLEEQWMAYNSRLQYHVLPVVNYTSQGRQRRRLQRRSGRPLVPALTPPPKRKADTVGECGICAENAAYEERMRQLRQRIQSRQAKQEEGRTGIKSYLPSHIRIRSMGSNGEPSSPVDPDERARRVRTVFCEDMSEITRMPRSPTPAPSFTGDRRRSL